MPKGGLSYKSLTACLADAKRKGVSSNRCDGLKDGQTRSQGGKKPRPIAPQPDPKKKSKPSSY